MKFETVDDIFSLDDLEYFQEMVTLGKIRDISDSETPIIDRDKDGKFKPKPKLTAYWKRYNKLIKKGKSKKQARKLARL